MTQPDRLALSFVGMMIVIGSGLLNVALQLGRIADAIAALPGR